MAIHKDGDYNEDTNGNNDGNNDNNSAYGSGSDDPIFDPIMMPQSRLGIAEDDRATTTIALQPRRHIYLCIGIYISYKYSINSILNMCHKLLYEKLAFWTYATET